MKVAILQIAPVHLDLKASLSKAVRYIEEAGEKGAQLVVLGETWFSGYPAWLDYSPEIAQWDHPNLKKVFARMMDSALAAEGEELKVLQSLAKDLKLAMVFGATERAPDRSKGTLYNSLFFIDENGILQNHHRKLVPTFTEKMLYGHGDGHGLQAVDMHGMKVTGSVCWEHWMPLTRQTLHNTGEQIHIAAWPKVHEMHQVASRQYAFEGRCFVLAAGQLLHTDAYPPELIKPESLSEGWVLNGGSCVIGPNGQFIVPPVWDQESLIIAELSEELIKEESMTLDVSGHYQREDVFKLTVNRDRLC